MNILYVMENKHFDRINKLQQQLKELYVGKNN